MNPATQRMWDKFVADFIFGRSKLNPPKRKPKKQTHGSGVSRPAGETFSRETPMPPENQG
jgi:hypothetical protein